MGGTQLQLLATPIIVVLPVFNEAPNLRPLVSGIGHALAGESIIYKILAVDDGSSDESIAILEELAQQFPVQTIRHPTNQGLGVAIRTGLLEALRQCPPGGLIVTMDADNSHQPTLIQKMLTAIRENADVVIASRFQPGSRTIGVPAQRRVLSKTASLLLRTLFPTPGVRDFTCGFRAYRADVLQRALDKFGDSLFESDGFQCMVDLLLKVRTLDVRFAEVPIVLRYDLKQGSSKMRVWRTIQTTLRLVIRRRLNPRTDDPKDQPN